MQFDQLLMAAATAPSGAVPITPGANAVDFDGAADYLSKAADLTGNADSTAFSLSIWLRLDGGDGSFQTILANESNYFRLSRNAADKFQITAYNAAGTEYFEFKSSTTYTAGSTWLNVLVSADMNFTAGNKISWLYVNDVSRGAAPNNDPAAAHTADLTRAGWGVMGTSAGATLANGCMSEAWFTNTYIDFSDVNNRRKFISALGKPVSLGADGSIPTGTAPLLYLRSAAASVGTNSGSGGNFTINGAPATASTTPND